MEILYSVLGVACILAFIIIIAYLLCKQRFVVTFKGQTLDELENQINDYTKKLRYWNIKNITIRAGEGQYYGYVFVES
jgi:hypothetical protein